MLKLDHVISVVGGLFGGLAFQRPKDKLEGAEEESGRRRIKLLGAAGLLLLGPRLGVARKWSLLGAGTLLGSYTTEVYYNNGVDSFETLWDQIRSDIGLGGE